MKIQNIINNFKQNTLRYSKYVWVAWGGLTSYKLADIGAAYFLGLKTWQHGTGPYGFVGIQLQGADPSFGGGRYGASSALKLGLENLDCEDKSLLKAGIDQADLYILNSRNFFHVTKDPLDESYIPLAINAILMPRCMAIITSTKYFFENLPKEVAKNGVLPLICGGITGSWTPLLRFHFEKGRTPPSLFDFDSGGIKTREAIPPYHLGISGSLYLGLNERILDRMRDSPYRTPLGASLLASSFYLAKQTRTWMSSPASPTQAETLTCIARRAFWIVAFPVGLWI